MNIGSIFNYNTATWTASGFLYINLHSIFNALDPSCFFIDYGTWLPVCLVLYIYTLAFWLRYLCFHLSVGCLARRMYAEKREAVAAIFLQKYVRGWLSRTAYMQLYSSAIILQSCVRGFSARQRYMSSKEHRAATLIQVASFQIMSYFLLFILFRFRILDWLVL